MKRIICLTIALCLCFGAISPVFAITETVDQGANTKLQNIFTKLTSFEALFSAWWSHDGSLDQTIQEGSFQSLAINIANLRQMFEDWIIPRNITDTTTYLGLWDYVWFIATKVNEYWDSWDAYLGNLPSIASYVSSWMQSNNGYLASQVVALTNINSNGNSYTIGQLRANAHRALVAIDTTYLLDFYSTSDGDKSTKSYNWNAGSPLGNIALIIQKLNQNFVFSASSLLYHFNDTLTTWEHSTNTQTTFTPSSLANGLYRYLAYIQSDTSSLWYDILLNSKISRNIYSNPSDSTYNSVSTLSTPDSLGDGILDYLQNINFQTSSTMQHLFRMVRNSTNPDILGGVQFYNPASLSIGEFNAYSISDMIGKSVFNLSSPLARLAFVHADDTDIAMKRQEAANDTAVANNFFGSGSAAASASDFGDIASASAAAKSNLSTGVSASGVWAVFNDPNWSYLTQATADSLMPTQQTRSEDISYDYETPYLDRYTEAVYNIIGFSTDELNPEDEQR